MSTEVTLKEQRDYAWSYFQLHANQRMTSFNFFVVIAALLTTGLARSLENDFGCVPWDQADGHCVHILEA
jgi:hypothetical protein